MMKRNSLLPIRASPLGLGDSGFDSALCRKVDAEWHFSQENGPLRHFKRSTVESKPP
jgi:hypothetical protein